MKFHFFLLRKTNTYPKKPLDQELPYSVQSSNSSCGDGSTNQSVVSSRDNTTKHGWFLFWIIRHRRFKNRNDTSPKNITTPSHITGSRVSSSPTTSTTTTKKESNVAPAIIDNDTPVSFVRIDPKLMDEMSQRDLLQKLTSTKLMKKHGLDREDSIISYFKQVDDAYNEMVIVVDHRPQVGNHVDDDSQNDEDFYNEENAINQSISLITMDPALMYRHSIVLDEYSWKSFQSISENDGEYDDYNDDNIHEPREDAVAPIRYCHI